MCKHCGHKAVHLYLIGCLHVTPVGTSQDDFDLEGCGCMAVDWSFENLLLVIRTGIFRLRWRILGLFDYNPSIEEEIPF